MQKIKEKEKMSLHIDPFTVKETKIAGLKIINAKMATDDSETFGAVETVYVTPGVQVFVPQGIERIFW